VTFAEIVDAIQERLDQPVRVRLEKQGRTVRTTQGVLKRGQDAPDVGATPEPDGQATFWVSPHTYWFRLSAAVVTDALEQDDGRLLRIEMGESDAFVIETLTQGA
jgi:hypothetical protein